MCLPFYPPLSWGLPHNKPIDLIAEENKRIHQGVSYVFSLISNHLTLGELTRHEAALFLGMVYLVMVGMDTNTAFRGLGWKCYKIGLWWSAYNYKWNKIHGVIIRNNLKKKNAHSLLCVPLGTVLSSASLCRRHKVGSAKGPPDFDLDHQLQSHCVLTGCLWGGR